MGNGRTFFNYLFNLALSRIFWILFLAAAPTLGNAAESHTLFLAGGVAVRNYDQIVASIKPNDQLRFTNGKVFRVKGALGKGNTTLVIETEEGLALRVPLRAGAFMDPISYEETPYSDFINKYRIGSRRLQRMGIEMPRIIDSLPSEYVLVEKVAVKFRLDQLLQGEVSLSRAELEEALSKLKSWAKQLWTVTYIGDFNESQVVYDGKRWILVDTTDGHHSVKSFMRRNKMTEIPWEHAFISEWGERPTPNAVFNEAEIDKLYSDLSRVIFEERVSHIAPRPGNPGRCDALFRTIEKS